MLVISGTWTPVSRTPRSEEHTSELQSRLQLVCRLLLEKKKLSTQRVGGILPAGPHLPAACRGPAPTARRAQPTHPVIPRRQLLGGLCTRAAPCVGSPTT